MRAEGTQPPLIIVDAGPFYRPLVRRLGGDQPVFGLSLPKLSMLPERFSVSDVAANLVEAPVRVGRGRPLLPRGLERGGHFRLRDGTAAPLPGQGSATPDPV